MKKVNGEWDKALVYDQRVCQIHPAKIRSIPNTLICYDKYRLIQAHLETRKESEEPGFSSAKESL